MKYTTLKNYTNKTHYIADYSKDVTFSGVPFAYFFSLPFIVMAELFSFILLLDLVATILPALPSTLVFLLRSAWYESDFLLVGQIFEQIELAVSELDLG